MKSLWASGLAHVKAGMTTLDELLRVCEVPFEAGPRVSTPVVEPAAPRGRESGSAHARTSGVVMRATPTGSAAVSPLQHDAFQLLDDHAHPHKRGAQYTVLLVEDEEPLRRVLKDLLEREGYVVAEARDGIEALDQVDRAAPDVVVLDLNLPKLDGYGVLTHLRSRAGTATLPVLVLTAKGDEDSEVRVFEFGASDFLTKPFRPRALSARLNSLLKR